ncbi:8-amino-7-oxononanoate synthase [Ferrimonas pelagia]|uniref:8-amino-7-oxononanoate synthase n=1 Tax=Ferrimonas pelagia TaxID=1177826 RepID=A0ABP9EKE6_9GAMM
MPHNNGWLQRTAQLMAERESQGLTRRRRCVDSLDPRTVEVEGRRYLQFASNDYLGLAFGDNRAAPRQGAAGSALISGYHPAHRALERLLCEATGYEAALLFSSGFAANSAPLALCRKGDRVLADKLAHASILDAALASDATLRRFGHNDMAMLARWLERDAALTLVATESVFSMDGDQAPLAAFVALCRQHGALSWVDDAHGLGIIGRDGLGASTIAKPDLLTLTFGKAMGASGAALLGSQALIDAIVQSARHYIYSTAIPVDLARHLAQQWQRLQLSDGRQRLQARIAQFRCGAQAQGWQLLDSASPIQPILVGESRMALALARRLNQAGIWCPAIRPPTVPKGQARLRVVINAGHEPEDIDRLLAALADARAQEGAYGDR